MAYLRFSDDCKIYFYERVGGGWECCGCLLTIGQKDPSAFFDDLDEAIHHLYAHVVENHITLDVADRTMRQLRGREDRTFDHVIADMVVAATSHSDGSKICSDDADVPAQLRWTTKELVEQMLEHARRDNDIEAVSGLTELLEMLTARGVRA